MNIYVSYDIFYMAWLVLESNQKWPILPGKLNDLIYDLVYYSTLKKYWNSNSD